MNLQHKIDTANLLYDEISKTEAKYDSYEEINHQDCIKIMRMHDIAINLVIDLIEDFV